MWSWGHIAYFCLWRANSDDSRQSQAWTSSKQFAKRMRMKPFYVVIVAAGRGERAGSDIPKQFRIVQDKPLLAHSVEAFLQYQPLAKIIIVLAEGQREQANGFLPKDPRIAYAVGGATRRDSVHSGLNMLQDQAASDSAILIHDAARPFGLQPNGTVAALLAALDANQAAVPVLPIADSMVSNSDIVLGGAVDRNDYLRVQTPQAFHYAAIKQAHDNWPIDAMEPTDDARMAQHFGHDVAIVTGDEKLAKITFAQDFERISGDMDDSQNAARTAPFPTIRTGIGYDVHRLENGEHIWLCGVKIAHNKKLKGHSDADVGLHALTDAILGALAMGDIGDHFPDTDPQWKGASSDRFLAHAGKLAQEVGYQISNVDVTLICEAPKIKPHREAMRRAMADILNIDVGSVSLKATTSEGLGFTGRGEGIAAQAIATLVG
jgi:2-C-methyl-D-erythritol 4-phosphate cytidylyltransferase/2-C-methyl-D-erythritol 2,4-cyclodiphosphate synthase